MTRWLGRISRDRSVHVALFVFTLTRVLIFTIFILGTNLSIVNEPTPAPPIKIQEAQISLYKSTIFRNLRPLARHCDCGHLIGIARNGYERQPFDKTKEHNWAYFPLFPLLLRLAATITGGFELTGMALANLLFLPALIILHKTVRALGYDEGVADRTLFYLAVYPMSYFFSLPMAESLFLGLTAGSLYAATRERWWTAGILGALASATRATGLLLLPALLIMGWQRYRGRPQLSMLGLFIIPMGLLVFMIYLYHITGNAFAFADVQVAWGRRLAFPTVALGDYLTNPLELARPWYLIAFHFFAGIMALICGLVLVKRREWALAFYTLMSVLVALSTSTLQSLGRYVMPLFPIFILLAGAGRSPRIDQTIRTVFLSLLVLISALYAAHFSFTFP